jgi:hypothetical protein
MATRSPDFQWLYNQTFKNSLTNIGERDMKKIALSLIVFAGFIFTACSVNKDAEVQDFISAADNLAAEIVQKVKANPTPAGLDEAQKILDGKKSEIKSKYDNVKHLRGYEVSEATMKKLTDSSSKNLESVNGLQVDFAEKTVYDQAFGEKITKLVKDYNALYDV